MIRLGGVGLDAPSTHGRPPRKLLDGIDLDIRKHECIALVGPNGAGKSLLIQVIAGLRQPSRGEIAVESPQDARARVGIVFQNPDDQIVGATVERDLAFGLENLQVPSEEIRRKVDEALVWGGLSSLTRTPPHLLSEGEKQRVALTSVLLLEPALLLLDEPTSRLDATGRLDFLRAIESARERTGAAVVHVTHSSRDALSCERILGLREGRLVFDGSPGEFLRSLESERLGMIWSSLHRFLRELVRHGVEPKDGRGAEWNDLDWVLAGLPIGLRSRAAGVQT